MVRQCRTWPRYSPCGFDLVPERLLSKTSLKLHARTRTAADPGSTPYSSSSICYSTSCVVATPYAHLGFQYEPRTFSLVVAEFCLDCVRQTQEREDWAVVVRECGCEQSISVQCCDSLALILLASIYMACALSPASSTPLGNISESCVLSKLAPMQVGGATSAHVST